ncbi:MAG: 4Fe-4S dicluster domain-containing protein [Candidatus Margulisbacteria bacterium]|nr:4Fe-4S dicluster domain-containing protein [Candidatus Margulisiibacteriota bacterium]MBU1617391.1 4Fe-4S dicluster domain-containing protein [Candidatus Margulisiibacteriota bacterium]
MSEYFVNNKDFEKLIRQLMEKAHVVAPAREYGRKYWFDVDGSNIDKIDLSGYRTVEPGKGYFFKTTELVARYFSGEAHISAGPLVLLGLRACDLEGVSVLDRVFGEGEFQDPFYQVNREKTILIGADCTDCGNSCFCPLVGGTPFPTRCFDLSLAVVPNGYVVEVGSDRGKRIVDDQRNIFARVLPQAEAIKSETREKVKEKLKQANRQFSFDHELHELHKGNLESGVWRELTKDCVECSSCNFICPTCSCFLLVDEAVGLGGKRHKLWDACLKAGYAKVAGGGNSRPRLAQRLQNRYHCKFDYSFDRLARYTCVGCGRCIDGCAGNIDMRQVFCALDQELTKRGGPNK